MNLMKAEGLELLTDTYDRLLRACNETKNYSRTQKLFKEMIDNGISRSDSSWAHLIQSDLSSNQVHAAFLHLNEMKRVDPFIARTRSYNYLLNHFAQINSLEEFRDLWDSMLSQGARTKRDFYTYTIALSYYAKLNLKSDLVVVLVEMTRARYSLTHNVWRFTHAPFKLSRDSEGLEELIQQLRMNGVTPKAYMWRDLIHIYMECGRCDDVYRALSRMKETDGLEPNFDCWIRVVRVFCEVKGYKEGLLKLQEMRLAGIRPTAQVWQYIFIDPVLHDKIDVLVELLREMLVVDNVPPRYALWFKIVKGVARAALGDRCSAYDVLLTNQKLGVLFLKVVPDHWRERLLGGVLHHYLDRGQNSPSLALDFISTFTKSIEAERDDVTESHPPTHSLSTSHSHSNGRADDSPLHTLPTSSLSTPGLTVSEWNLFLLRCLQNKDLELCKKAVRLMVESRVLPTVETWSIVADCYAALGLHQEGSQAIERFLKDWLEGLLPKEDLTKYYNLRLSLLAADGRGAEQCLALFKVMQRDDVPRDKYSHKHASRALVHMKRFDEAAELLEQVWLDERDRSTLTPEDVREFYGPLLSACVANKRHQRVEAIFHSLFERDVKLFAAVSHQMEAYLEELADRRNADNAVAVTEMYHNRLSRDATVTSTSKSESDDAGTSAGTGAKEDDRDGRSGG